MAVIIEEKEFYMIVFSGELIEDYSIEEIYYSEKVARKAFENKWEKLHDRSGWTPVDMLKLISMPMPLIDKADELVGKGTSEDCYNFINTNIGKVRVITNKSLGAK